LVSELDPISHARVLTAAERMPDERAAYVVWLLDPMVRTDRDKHSSVAQNYQSSPQKFGQRSKVTPLESLRGDTAGTTAAVAPRVAIVARRSRSSAKCCG